MITSSRGMCMVKKGEAKVSKSRVIRIAIAASMLAGAAHAAPLPNGPDSAPRPPAAYAAMKPTSTPRDYVMLVFSRPTPGNEAEFNRWYSVQHVPDILQVPGMVAGQRFAMAMELGSRVVPPPYLVTFDFRTRDLVAMTAENRRRMINKIFVPSDSFDYSSTVSGIYQKLGHRVSAQHGATASMAGSMGKPVRRYTMFVLSEPVVGQEAEYNRWYDSEHVHDVLRIPGFKSAQRYIARRRVPENAIPLYIVRYELESANLDATKADMIGRIRSGQTKISPSFNGSTSITRFYEALTPVIRARKGRP
jgi:hypothetical protein